MRRLYPQAEKAVLVMTLLLLSGPLWSEVVGLVRVPSLGQIDLFKNYSYFDRSGNKKKKKKERKELKKQQKNKIKQSKIKQQEEPPPKRQQNKTKNTKNKQKALK